MLSYHSCMGRHREARGLFFAFLLEWDAGVAELCLWSMNTKSALEFHSCQINRIPMLHTHTQKKKKSLCTYISISTNPEIINKSNTYKSLQSFLNSALSPNHESSDSPRVLDVASLRIPDRGLFKLELALSYIRLKPVAI